MSKIISNIQNDFTDCETERNNNKITITKDDQQVELSYILKNCKIKYLPKKFDKLVVEIDKDSSELLKPLYEFMKGAITNLTSLDKNKLSLKIDANTKDKLSASEIGQSIDIAFEFNDVWVLNKTAYPSFKLLQFKVCKNKEVNLLD